MGFLGVKMSRNRQNLTERRTAKRQKRNKKTLGSEQAAWRKWGGELHRTCKYRFTPHLRQAAPDHSLFFFFFFSLRRSRKNSLFLSQGYKIKNSPQKPNSMGCYFFCY